MDRRSYEEDEQITCMNVCSKLGVKMWNQCVAKMYMCIMCIIRCYWELFMPPDDSEGRWVDVDVDVCDDHCGAELCGHYTTLSRAKEREKESCQLVRMLQKLPLKFAWKWFSFLSQKKTIEFMVYMVAI